MTDEVLGSIHADAAEMLRVAVEKIGGQSETARRCKIRQQTISFWMKTGKPVPLKYVEQIADEAGMLPSDLRPDLVELFSRGRKCQN